MGKIHNKRADFFLLVPAHGGFSIADDFIGGMGGFDKAGCNFASQNNKSLNKCLTQKECNDYMWLRLEFSKHVILDDSKAYHFAWPGSTFSGFLCDAWTSFSIWACHICGSRARPMHNIKLMPFIIDHIVNKLANDGNAEHAHVSSLSHAICIHNRCNYHVYPDNVLQFCFLGLTVYIKSSKLVYNYNRKSFRTPFLDILVDFLWSYRRIYNITTLTTKIDYGLQEAI